METRDGEGREGPLGARLPAYKPEVANMPWPFGVAEIERLQNSSYAPGVRGAIKVTYARLALPSHLMGFPIAATRLGTSGDTGRGDREQELRFGRIGNVEHLIAEQPIGTHEIDTVRIAVRQNRSISDLKMLGTTGLIAGRRHVV
jgi:hypothetical protein